MFRQLGVFIAKEGALLFNGSMENMLPTKDNGVAQNHCPTRIPVPVLVSQLLWWDDEDAFLHDVKRVPHFSSRHERTNEKKLFQEMGCEDS